MAACPMIVCTPQVTGVWMFGLHELIIVKKNNVISGLVDGY